MTLRTHRSLPFLRLFAVMAVAGVIAFALTRDGRGAPPADANPAFGTARITPVSGTIIEGHSLTFKVNMTTCADNASPVTGTATSGTATTLTNTSASWTTNQWAGYDVMLSSGTGAPQTRVVASNTSNTLTLASSWGGVVDSGTVDASAIGSVLVTGTNAAGPHTTTTLKDPAKSWTANQYVGKTLALTGGSGSGQARVIVSNTTDTLSVTPAWVTVPTATTDYQIEEPTTVVDTGSNWLGTEHIGRTVEFPTLDPGQTRTVTHNSVDTLSVWPGFTNLVAQNPATGGTASTLTDSGTGWTTNAFANKTVQIVSGPASPQSRKIVSNTATALTIEGTWTTSAGGSLTSGSTTTVLVDATQSWTANEFAGMTLDMISGAQNGQSRTIASNTATTITLSSALPGAPAFGDFYRVLQVPTAASQYVVREGPAIGTTFQIKDNSAPAAGTGYQLFKSACRPAGFDLTVGYDEAKYDLLTESGQSSGGNTSTTLIDNTQVWKDNQWSGSRITIVLGPGTGQTRIVASNTKTRVVVSQPWTTTPTASSIYILGGMADGGWLESSNRTVNCPSAPVYGPGSANLGCVTLGTPPYGLPQGPTGTGTLVTLTLKATGRGITNFTTSGQIVEVDGTPIPADILGAGRRVILCPDSAPFTPGPDGIINVADLAATKQATGQGPGDPLYTPQKNPDENAVINIADLALVASVTGQRCVQLSSNP